MQSHLSVGSAVLGSEGSDQIGYQCSVQCPTRLHQMQSVQLLHVSVCSTQAANPANQEHMIKVTRIDSACMEQEVVHQPHGSCTAPLGTGSNTCAGILPRSRKVLTHLTTCDQVCKRMLLADLKYAVVDDKSTGCKPNMQGGWLWLLQPERIHEASVYVMSSK